MRFVVQRVKEASVTVEQEMIGKIGHGLLVFVGVSDTDDKQIADKMIDKLTKLRIFDDAEGKTNLAVADVNGEFLIISQFTLYADCKKGNRPSFVRAGKPDGKNNRNLVKAYYRKLGQDLLNDVMQISKELEEIAQ